MTEKSILFVGNSYTYYNNMPEELFSSLAKEAGLSLSVSTAVKGGARLRQYADPNTEHSRILQEAIAGKQFDLVILQEQSHTPVSDEATFLQGIAAVKEILKNKTDLFFLYATWGRKEGSDWLTNNNMTSQEMTQRLAQAYDRAGERFDMPVIHVGKKFAEYRSTYPDAELYDPDLSHPSVLGSQLAAETIWSAVKDFLCDTDMH